MLTCLARTPVWSRLVILAGCGLLAAGCTTLAAGGPSGPQQSGSVAAPVAPSAALDAATSCATTGMATAVAYGHVDAVAAARALPIGQLRAWESQHAGDVSGNAAAPQWASVPAGQSVAVCFYDGTFTGFPVPPGARDTFDRLMIVVTQDGVSAVEVAGFRAQLPTSLP